jgi:hypothetical protein
VFRREPAAGDTPAARERGPVRLFTFAMRWMRAARQQLLRVHPGT